MNPTSPALTPSRFPRHAAPATPLGRSQHAASQLPRRVAAGTASLPRLTCGRHHGAGSHPLRLCRNVHSTHALPAQNSFTHTPSEVGTGSLSSRQQDHAADKVGPQFGAPALCSRQSSTSDSGSGSSSTRRALLMGSVAAGVALLPSFGVTGQGPALRLGAAARAAEVLLPPAAPARGSEGESLLDTRAPPPGSLEERILTSGDVTNPGNSLLSKPGVILYPKWMFGEWKVTSHLRGFRTPVGPQFVDPGLVQSAQMELKQDEPLQYTMRFFSTLPDTLGNQLKFNLGIMPNDAIAEDRAFNTTSLTNATAGWNAVTSASYDPTNTPDRETVEFSRLAPDMQPLPPRRAELYINNTRSESPDPSVFVTSQLYRQVMLGVRQVDTTDYEVMTRYEAFPQGLIRARQRTAIYLQPYDPGFFKAFGRAVAIYDHDLEMRRVPAPDDAPGAAACVKTPKEDFVQCL